MKLNESWEY